MSRAGIYAGSFDPLTNGHINVIEQGLGLFDHLFIVIGVNPAKKYWFTTEERIDMIQNYLDDMGFGFLATVISFEGEFLADVAERVHADHLLRGIRNAKDLGDELELKMFNDKYKPNIRTVFVSPPPELVGVSSSIVRGCFNLKNWEHAMKDYTTPYVISKLNERLTKFY